MVLPINVVGGLCLLKGEYVLIINSKATVKDRIKTLAMAVKHFDLDQIYIPSVLRKLLDRIPVFEDGLELKVD